MFFVGVPTRALRCIPHSATTLYGLQFHSRRTFITSALAVVGARLPCEEFLDLAIALPLPSSFPSYTTTILLVTVASRLIFTVPFAIWARKRQLIAEEVVMPKVQKLVPLVGKDVMKEMQGFVGTKEEIQREHGKRSRKKLEAIRKELFIKYSCRTAPTAVVPIASQFPVFIGMTAMLAQLSQHPTPFDSESFLTLTSLAAPDPTNMLPLLTGVVTLANVESSQWFRTSEQKERDQKVDAWTAEKRARGETVIRPKVIFINAMRGLSVIRIIIGFSLPGSVMIYWASSGIFGLVQNWVFDWWNIRRKAKLAASKTLPPTSSPSPAASPPWER